MLPANGWREDWLPRGSSKSLRSAYSWHTALALRALQGHGRTATYRHRDQSDRHPPEPGGCSCLARQMRPLWARVLGAKYGRGQLVDSVDGEAEVALDALGRCDAGELSCCRRGRELAWWMSASRPMAAHYLCGVRRACVRQLVARAL